MVNIYVPKIVIPVHLNAFFKQLSNLLNIKSIKTNINPIKLINVYPKFNSIAKDIIKTIKLILNVIEENSLYLLDNI